MISERYVDLPTDQYQNMLKYFIDLSDGKTWNSYYWSDLFTKNHKYNTSRTIFKTHKVNYYFDSLMANFKDDYGIFLVRHPIAVSLSRIRMGWSTYIDQYESSIRIKGAISHEMRRSIKQIKESGSELEKQVLNWCLENSVFIQHQHSNSLPENIITIIYEELILQPEKSLKKLCNQINMPFHSNMLKIMEQPSTGIVHSKKEVTDDILKGNRFSLVNNWKSEVDPITLKRLENLIKIFGADFYLEGNDFFSSE